MSEGAASDAIVSDRQQSPLADAYPYLVCISRGATRLIDKFDAKDLNEACSIVEEKARKRDSWWVIDQATDDRVKLEGLS